MLMLSLNLKILLKQIWWHLIMVHTSLNISGQLFLCRIFLSSFTSRFKIRAANFYYHYVNLKWIKENLTNCITWIINSEPYSGLELNSYNILYMLHLQLRTLKFYGPSFWAASRQSSTFVRSPSTLTYVGQDQIVL